MKLAEALILRADAQRRVGELVERLKAYAKIQAGEKPPEQPSDLLQELDAVFRSLEDLIQRINRTNSSATLSDGTIVSDALATRDVLLLRRKHMLSVIAASDIKQDRYSKSEIQFKRTMDVADLRKAADDLAKRYRELDAKVQECNWSTDLLD